MAQTPKYKDDYELAQMRLNQRLGDIRIKFNEVMAQVAHTIREDLKQPYDDRLDLSNAAQQRIANLGYEVMELMRDTHKASVAYHKAKARYGKRKG